MKKYFKILTIIVTVLILSVYSKALAASGSLSVNKSTVYVGDSFTVTASVSYAAAWNVHVTASGPVANCSINQAGDSGDGSNIGKQFSATCTATGVGTINISMSGDVSQQNEDFSISKSYLSGSRSVSVIEKPAPTPDPTPTPTPSGGGNNSNNKQEEKKSNNAKLKSIRIDDHSLVKIDDNNYILTVNTDVTSININAEAQDSKAIVTGLGLFELHDGENPFEITITAEDGTTKNVIKIVVTRKEEEKKEEDIKPVEPEKKEPKKEKKKINIGLKDYLLIGSLVLNVLLVIVCAIVYSKYYRLKESTKNMVYDSRDLPFDYRKENEK